MQTIEQMYTAEVEEKKSTFLAYLCPMSDFESLHVKLKNDHPKAAHIVWAKRFYNEFRQVVENNSDDGEPKGTSGPPVLNVMRGVELIEAGLLIVRYFGGIKLGTGGLVRAYGSSAKEVIAHAKLLPFLFKEILTCKTDYPLVPRFEHYTATQNITIVKREFESDGVVWVLEVSEEEKEQFLLFAHPFERDGFKRL
ncbi:YigZ family protein [Sulfurospirillum diekertiae]|uniref:YigZ family protein n=1 Tax=Sulfurospirillum diekertiae TaxID=1854492 RepID=A0A6G9VRR0_9BACT|nr:YigZ family protein [Sulfurospirillum diekertiae]QIR75326.1 YigZ family protein [Sulfurospirillum diekertiae]QIR77978.1 YigZ family protein [Sulfurospirillum diekertiae]